MRDEPPLPPTETTVATRLVECDAEPFPYTKVRDWIALLAQDRLSDGAFRLYFISRSVIWENTKAGPPPRPVIEITYEEYAAILGRSPRTISRFAEDLYSIGLWEEIARTFRSIKIPGKAKHEVRTVITVRVHDYPREPWTWDGPVKTWDVLTTIRETKREAQDARVAPVATDPVSSSDCALTSMSTQTGQDQCASGSGGPLRPDAPACDRTDLSSQKPVRGLHAPAEDHHEAALPAKMQPLAARSDQSDLAELRTDLSGKNSVSAAQSTKNGSLKKKVQKEETSLPPPSAQRDTLADELAMFRAETIELVAQLYDTTLTYPGLQPLSAADRAGLARRIDGRLTEGWSLSRIRAVLTGGSLVGVKMPGRLWTGRLDDMPTHPNVPSPRAGTSNHRVTEEPTGVANRRRTRDIRASNDCSRLPDPNPGKTRYEVPDDRGTRMAVRWADTRRVVPWCGHCCPDARTLRPLNTRELPRPCPACHPEPDAFCTVPMARTTNGLNPASREEGPPAP